jgi:hypothetical protein
MSRDRFFGDFSSPVYIVPCKISHFYNMTSGRWVSFRGGRYGTKNNAESIRNTSVRKKSSCYRKCPLSHSRRSVENKEKSRRSSKKILQISQQYPSEAKMTRRTVHTRSYNLETLYVLLEATITVLDVKFKKFLCLFNVK